MALMIMSCIGHGHFGDCWITAQYAIQQALAGNDVSINACAGLYSHKIIDKGPRKDRTKLFEEIFDAIDSPAVNIKFTREFPNIYPQIVTNYFPTKNKWSCKRHNRIAYQFDCGRSAGRYIPSDVEQIFIDNANKNSIKYVKVGLPFSVAECIGILATSDVFFGVNSGMTHLARSVGIPTVIIKYRQKTRHLIEWHGDSGYHVVNDVEAAMFYVMERRL